MPRAKPKQLTYTLSSRNKVHRLSHAQLDRMLELFRQYPSEFPSKSSKTNRVWQIVDKRNKAHKAKTGEETMMAVKFPPDGGEVETYTKYLKTNVGRYEKKQPPKTKPNPERAREIIASRPKPPRKQDVEGRQALSAAIATGRRAHKIPSEKEHRGPTHAIFHTGSCV